MQPSSKGTPSSWSAVCDELAAWNWIKSEVQNGLESTQWLFSFIARVMAMSKVIEVKYKAVTRSFHCGTRSKRSTLSMSLKSAKVLL